MGIIINQKEERKWYLVLFFPMLFVFLLFFIKYLEFIFQTDFYSFGVYPRKIKGLIGIFAAPLIHGGWEHLISNAVPILVLGGGLFYYFKDLGYKIFFSIYLATGLWVWVSARPAYHIGASGVVYGLVSFFVLSAVLRKNKYLLFFSLLVIFLYGSLIWGVFPLKPNISWESHLMGMIAGLFMAIYYRKIGLQRELFSWEINPESDDVEYDWSGNENELEEKVDEAPSPQPKIIYHFKEKEE